MGLFVALLEFTEEEALRQRTRAGHREYLRTLLEAGKLVMTGPWLDDTGALLIYEAEDMAEAERRLDATSYQGAGVMANARIKEWRVVLQASPENQQP